MVYDSNFNGFGKSLHHDIWSFKCSIICSGYADLSERLVQGIHVDGMVFTGQSWVNGLLTESILGVEDVQAPFGIRHGRRSKAGY